MNNNSNIDKNFDVKKYLESVLPLIKHYIHINDYKNAFNLLLHIFAYTNKDSRDFVNKIKN